MGIEGIKEGRGSTRPIVDIYSGMEDVVLVQIRGPGMRDGVQRKGHSPVESWL